MYKNSAAAGPVEAHQRRIIAVTASGARDTVTPYLLGLSITVLDQRYTRPLAVGDSSAVPSLIERLNRGRPRTRWWRCGWRARPTSSPIAAS